MTVRSAAPDGYRIETNQLFKDINALKHTYETLRDRLFTSAIVIGPPGLGKSFYAESICNTKDRSSVLRLVHPHADQVVETLYRYRHERYILFFDDVDTIFDSPALVDVLRVAANPHIKRIIIDPRIGPKGIGQFEFKARLIFVTNKKLLAEDLTGIVPAKVREAVNALRSRFHRRVELSFSREDCFHYACWIGTDGASMLRNMVWKAPVKGSQPRRLSIEASNECLRWFAENYPRLHEVSPRALKILAEFRLKLPNDWRPAAEELCYADAVKRPDGTNYKPMDLGVWQIPPTDKPSVRKLRQDEKAHPTHATTHAPDSAPIPSPTAAAPAEPPPPPPPPVEPPPAPEPPVPEPPEQPPVPPTEPDPFVGGGMMGVKAPLSGLGEQPPVLPKQRKFTVVEGGGGRVKKVMQSPKEPAKKAPRKAPRKKPAEDPDPVVPPPAEKVVYASIEEYEAAVDFACAHWLPIPPAPDNILELETRRVSGTPMDWSYLTKFKKDE